MTSRSVLVVLLAASTSALAAKPCEELKTEIAAQIDSNHVASYTLEIVSNDQVGDRKVVGSCDGEPGRSSTKGMTMLPCSGLRPTPPPSPKK